MVCNRCKNIINENSEKCPHCGMLIRNNPSAMNNPSVSAVNKPQEKKDNSMKIVLIVMGCLGGLFFFVLLMVLLLSFSGTGPSYNEYDFDNSFGSGDSYSDITTDSFISETTTSAFNSPQITAPLQQSTTVPAVSTTAPQSQVPASGLTEKEIISLYTDANRIYEGWINYGWNAKNQDYKDSITIGNSRYYRVVSADYMSVDEINNVCSKYFEKGIYENQIDLLYKMSNGKLYAVEGIGQGGGDFYESFVLDVVEGTDDYCKFTVSCCNNNISEKEFTNEIRKVNGNWIFVNEFVSSFSLYYNENITWSY